ncbi:hydroxysqualene dehydroxylase HpnE [Paraburkholderia sp. DHOC27]|uniref:hydroxysqualene dehydroxylase HpnE n=1 Tax=Paraburkholderia sp. DHOC27 TaxID=2303330 RepID=UPI000E3E4D57|nr:hydroxysqualene dehydroxylase HpnE [Paraburkholderia sp. DHOC27]RFU48660.1 FAD-binding protein [Paraburkholderia sp. DHOC27]
MGRRVHVIGAGLAGLAAAVQLQRRGAQVVLHEAAAQAGGRCRSWYDHTLGTTIDSGNHVLFSGNHAALAYLRAIGAADQLEGPAQPEFAFADLKTRAHWSVRPTPGRLPWWIFDPAARVPNSNPGDYLSLVPLLFARPGRTVAQTVQCDGVVWERLLRPLLRTVLNVEPREASAEMTAGFVRETLLAGGAACRTLTARHGLSSAFVDPALRLLQHGGAAIRLDSRLDDIVFSERGRVSGLRFADEHIELEPGAGVVLTTPPHIAQKLVPGMQAPNRFTTRLTVHFAVEPPFGVPPLTGLLNGTAEWLMAFDGHLSVTVNDAGRLIEQSHEALAEQIWAEVAQVVNLPLAPMPAWLVVPEVQAGFAPLPDQEMRRPGTRTRWNNLMLAGDWTATGLPATLEGAIRSGQKAADTLLNEPMERR